MLLAPAVAGAVVYLLWSFYGIYGCALAVGLLPAALCAMLYLQQDGLLYPAVRGAYHRKPDNLRPMHHFEELTLTCLDGTR